MAAVLGLSAVVMNVKANMTVYQLYLPTGNQYFMTDSTYEKSCDMKYGWTYQGVNWQAPSSGTAVYRTYNPNSGEHFFTTSHYEAAATVKAGCRWDNNGKSVFYSGGQEPVYRLYKSGQPHRYTPNISQVNSWANQGWKKEGIAFYAIYPNQNWSFDTMYYTYSAQKGDVHTPQFDYLNSNGQAISTYQNNNTYASYNNAIYNFNQNLAQVATDADYANWQARQKWSQQLNDLEVNLNQAQATVNAAQAQVKQYQILINQQQTYISEDQKEGLPTLQDQTLLNQYQINLDTANHNLTQTQATYNALLAKKNSLIATGTDYVKLSYNITRSVDNKKVTIHFNQSNKLAGKITNKPSNLTSVLSR